MRPPPATFAHYKDFPSYRGMLDREGKPGVEDLAITGDEAAVTARLEQVRDAGVTDLVAFIYDTDDQSRAPHRSSAGRAVPAQAELSRAI